MLLIASGLWFSSGETRNWAIMMKDVPKSDWYAKENRARWDKMYEETRTSPAHKQHVADFDHAQKALQEFVDSGAAGKGSPEVPHGYVWLFRRK